jgi:hypothetical protein
VKIGPAAPAAAPAPALNTAAPAEALAAAAKFKDRVVFLPRNFVAPFLRERAELLSGAAEDR